MNQPRTTATARRVLGGHATTGQAGGEDGRPRPMSGLTQGVPERAARLRPLTRLGVVVTAAAAATASLWPLWTSQPAAATTTLCVTVAFVFAGFELLPDRRTHTIGLLFVTAAYLWPTSFLTVYQSNVMINLGHLGNSLF